MSGQPTELRAVVHDLRNKSVLHATLCLARATRAAEVRQCDSLSIQPRVGGSKTDQLQRKDVAKNTLHPTLCRWLGDF